MSTIETCGGGEPEDETQVFRQNIERQIREDHPGWSDEQVEWLVDASIVMKVVEEYEYLLHDPNVPMDHIRQKFQEVKRVQKLFWDKLNE